MKCTSWLGHKWLYKSRHQNEGWFLDGYEFDNGDLRLCTRCGLVEEQVKMFWDEKNWYPQGYAEDKDAMIKAWRQAHQEEREANKRHRQARQQKVKNNKISIQKLATKEDDQK